MGWPVTSSEQIKFPVRVDATHWLIPHRWFSGVVEHVMEGGYEILWDDGSANEILARDVRRAAVPKPRGAREAVSKARGAHAAAPKPRGRPRTTAAASGPALSVGDRVSLLLDDVEGDITKCSLKGGWYEVVLETCATANSERRAAPRAQWRKRKTAGRARGRRTRRATPAVGL